MADLTDFSGEALERQSQQLETLDRLAQNFGRSLSGALATSTESGKRLDGVLASIGRSLADTALKSAVGGLQNAVKGGLQSLLSSATNAASLMSFGGAFPFAKGGVLAGGAVTPFASGGVVAAPTYFPLGRQLGVMGEAGAEAILPLARGADGRLGVQAGGAAGRPIAVTLNVATPDADSFRRSEAQVSAALARAVARGRRAL